MAMTGRALRRAVPWIALGAMASVGLLAGSRLTLLLVPTVVVGAFLIWQLQPRWEVFAALIGLAIMPLSLAVRTQICPDWDGVTRCPEPYNPIGFLLAAALMLATGTAAAVLGSTASIDSPTRRAPLT